MRNRSGVKRILAIVMAVMLAVTLAVPAIAAPAKSDSNRTVRVGFFAYPGYHEINDGVRSGYGYDFLMLLQRYTNLNYEFIGYDKSWEEMQEMLRNGELDLVTSARKTVEREKEVDFSQPIGKNSAQLDVRIDDDRFIPGDFRALNGITIGLISGNSRNADLEDFAREKGFTYKTKEYSTADELEKALQIGEVDAVVSSSLRKATHERTIAEFAPQDFYVVVQKGNDELLQEINYGIGQMDANEGNWRDDLYYKNYQAESATVLGFTQREKDYIRAVQNGEKTITVSAQPDRDPYSFVKGGKLTGIIPDYFAHLMQMAGLPYETLVAKDRDQFQEWTLTNYTDVVMDCRYGSAPTTEIEFGLVTDPYMQLTTSRVTQKGFSGEIRTVATVDSQGPNYIEEGIAEDAEYIIVDTREAAMEAVRDGDADACFVYTYMAEKFINTDPDSNLQSTVMDNPVYNEYIYISPDADHELCSILNKCIKAASPNVLDGYINKYTTVSYEGLTLGQYLRHHPMLLLLLALLLVLVAILVAMSVVRARTTSMKNAQLERELEQQRKLDESLIFTNFFLDPFVSAYYVNLDTQDYQVYKSTQILDENYLTNNNYSESIRAYIDRDVHPEDREGLLEMVQSEKIKEMLENQSEYTYTFRDMTDGEERVFRMQVIRGADAQHAAIGFEDISDELQAELNRRNIAARDAAVISGLSDDFGCVVYVDTDTLQEDHYRFDPLLAATIPGWDTITNFEERLNTLGNTAVYPDDREIFIHTAENREEILGTVAREGVFYRNFRVVVEGEIKYYQLKIVRAENSANHIIVGMRNVDETVKREMEYQARLEAANRSKTDFLFNMSHDIRTPMNAIIGFTQLAKKHIDDRERTVDSLNKIESSGNHLLGLINEVLDMSRVEAGKLHSEMKTVNVADAAKRLVTICRESAGQRDISLVFREKNIIHPVVEADELHINQIIMNVLGNAIKYSKPGGTVTYTVEEAESMVPGYGKYILTIEDTGIGMSQEFLGHVFEAFSREDDASTSRIAGTGLGMAIVKRLVDYMDGTIDIESEKGAGTRVTIVLHLLHTDAEVKDSQTENPVVDLKGKKALLVEDNELNREIATEILEDQGVTVDEAVNGIDAVEKVKSCGVDSYDFILMDIQMPLMDGYQATVEIRKLPGAEDLPIIALSANAFEEDRQKSLEAGMNDHVSKPIVLSELMAALGKYVK